MKNRSEAGDALDDLKERLVGLGEGSLRKTYYPQLQDRIEALRESEAFLKSIVENIPAMVFVKDAAEFRYVAVNRAWEELLGISRDELIGKRDRELFPAEQAAFFTQKDREALEKGELLEIPEEAIKTRHGGNRILRVKKIPLFDGSGNPRYVLGIAEDITDRRLLEEQLLQSQKMEAVGQLAGGVAHDFNNILMVIMGYGGILRADPALNVQQKEKVDQILEAAERAAHVTRSLLEFSRKQVMQLRPTNLNDIVRHVEKFLVRIIGADIRLQTHLREGDLPVVADSGQIEQVIINLATNARDAMPRGGGLTIETGFQEVGPALVQAYGCGEPGQYAVISVSDTGTGMDETTRNRIFEPFFTTKEVGKGTGLGMAIVYGIVKQHRGFVAVESEPGKGTTFRIHIPLREHQPEADEGNAAPELPKGGTETILVADDEPAVRRLVAEILGSAGYEVILAEDGRDAVEKFEAGSDRIGLVLMDMVMPRMSGRDACDEIRKRNAEVRVIYISGYPKNSLRQGDLPEGTELLLKPVQPQELLQKVREALDGK